MMLNWGQKGPFERGRKKKKSLSVPNSLGMAEFLIIDKIYSLPLHNGNCFCVLDR